MIMAQFTAHGRLKLLFNGEGVFLGSEPRDPHRYKLLLGRGGDGVGGVGRSGLRLHKRKLRFLGSTTARIFYSCSHMDQSKQHLNAVNVTDDGVHAQSDNYDVYDDGEFERDDLACFRGLVLDISYRPVNVVCWKRAICLEFMEKADVLEYYDQTVNSPSGSFYIPAVLRVPHLLQVVKRRRIKSNLSRKNILHRDNYTCQYCSSNESLTIDHVLPIARGGEWKWENLVAACVKCNSKKGQKTLEETNMKLIKVPKAPKDYDILAIPLTSAAIRMLKMRKGTPEEWRQYLLSKPSSEP